MQLKKLFVQEVRVCYVCENVCVSVSLDLALFKKLFAASSALEKTSIGINLVIRGGPLSNITQFGKKVKKEQV